WLALYCIQHFEREVIATSGEVTKRSADQVVRDDGGDGGSQASRGRDKRFRNSGCNGPQSCCSAGTKAVKGIDDAPNCTEQSDQRSYSTGDSQPGKIALKTRHLFRRGDLHGTLNGERVPQSA